MKKHYIKTQVPVEKKTLFGKKTVYEEKIVQVDDAAWEKYRAAREQERLKKEKEEIFARALREEERRIKEEIALREQERRLRSLGGGADPRRTDHESRKRGIILFSN